MHAECPSRSGNGLLRGCGKADGPCLFKANTFAANQPAYGYRKFMLSMPNSMVRSFMLPGLLLQRYKKPLKQPDETAQRTLQYITLFTMDALVACRQIGALGAQ